VVVKAREEVVGLEKKEGEAEKPEEGDWDEFK
jgi:hypothetical protein